MKRRHFNKAGSALILSPFLKLGSSAKAKTNDGNIVMATWNNRNAVEICNKVLQSGSGNLLDAIEKAVNSVEADPNDSSVGYGGFPDNTGKLSLDASIMDNMGNAGSVAGLENVMYAVSVARKVMELTPHVLLVGDGARKFALENDMKEEDLLTPKSLEAYNKWLEKAQYAPKINAERHDTIGLIARNKNLDFSGACSTSGLAFKMKGRVGDSPIIGAGLYVDNEVGAATATGYGELMLKQCSSFLIVEEMRRGASPQEACYEATRRISKHSFSEGKQAGFIAINKNGDYGAFSLRPGFNYIISIQNSIRLEDSESYFN